MMQREREDELPLISTNSAITVKSSYNARLKILSKILSDYVLTAGIGGIIIHFGLYSLIGNRVKAYAADELTAADSSTSIETIAKILCSDANNTNGCQRLLTGILEHYLPLAPPFIRSMPLGWLDWLIVGLSTSFMVFFAAALLVHSLTRATTAGLISTTNYYYRACKRTTPDILPSIQSRKLRGDSICTEIHGPAVL